MNSEILVEAVAELAQVATGNFSAEALLGSLCVVAVRAFDVDGAGVMIVRNDQNVFVQATSDQVRPLEVYQELMRSGPCAEAVANEAPILVPDLSLEDRWPPFTALARDQNLSAVAAVPLLSRGKGWGVLDLYRVAARPWTVDEVAGAKILADVAVSYLVMAHDRDKARLAQDELAHRAMHDDLTGLPTRGLLMDRLEHALSVAVRTRAQTAAVFVDIDLFKSVNDSFGHSVGDAVLTELAVRMRKSLRAGDTLARFAGDEFVLVCEGVVAEDRAAFAARVTSLAQRVGAAISRPLEVDSVEIVVTASIGIAIAGQDERAPSARELIADADTAMYSAKQSGRGRTVVRDHSTGVDIGYARQLGHDLARAVLNDEFTVYYQPIVDTLSHRTVAVEALVRWNHPRDGLLPAAAFIDIAVRTGVVNTVGRWVIDEVCKTMRTWMDEFGDTGPTTAYINLSARELLDPTLGYALGRSLAAHRIDAAHIGIEIVEDDLSDPIQIARLLELHDLGHPLSIDDFGTGYSSLSRLLEFPAVLAKIDRSFITGLPNKRNARVVEAIMAMAKALDIQVIAEGIETDEQARVIEASGCQMMQGYFFGVPQSSHELEETWRYGSSAVIG
ncbi:hypothetical protein GCM10007304_32840 [Rhodococcoides trifolii]|uniref:EAL domain-containing protein n=1 Tax=Rhodococcoides trifolii TaxID=908250 RepID=A0A917G0P0_9NOCA|nr:EAL domain-containing protein [Rhodococcus trifolii]GGG16162.1 hypothetical protein GCM10007304_32840 [Rhodococcus trifolii]